MLIRIVNIKWGNRPFYGVRQNGIYKVQRIEFQRPHGNAKDRVIRLWFWVKAKSTYGNNKGKKELIRFRDDEIITLPKPKP